MKYPVQVLHEIPPGRVSNLFVGSFEGGSNHWLHVVRLVSSSIPKVKGEVWYGQEAIFEGEYEFTLEMDNPKGGDDVICVLYSQKDVAKALQAFAEKYPANFAEFIQELDDAGTADLFMQVLCFGEEIYS